MDCNYLLLYGEGFPRDQNYLGFYAATPEEAQETAEKIVSVQIKRAERPKFFSATLYRPIKEWR